jgi:hypothetical protein
LQLHIHALQSQIQQMHIHAPSHPQVAQLQASLQARLQAINPPHPLQLTRDQQQHTFNTLVSIKRAYVDAMMAAGAFPQRPFTNQSTQGAQAVLKAQPRVGSWLSILDIISPGLNLSDFGSEFSRADSERTTSLENIRLTSCGYARLPNFPLFDTPDMTAGPINRRELYHNKMVAFGPAMLSQKWPLLGEIIQEVDGNELSALCAAWNLEIGWRDAEAAEGPEFDGLLPGGTGRFNGVVQRRIPSADD